MPTNPSGAGSFFGGLSTGIFDNLHKQKLSQLESDKAKKGQTLKYLTSLLDQTTPDTRPLLMRHIGDVMGLKGKHRGLWDTLTGKGDMDYSNALDESLTGILGNVVGPEQYEQLKGGPQFDAMGAQAGAGGGPAWMGASMAPDQMAGKIALEDPNAAKLKLMEAQYGLQRKAGLEKLEESQRLIGERQGKLQEDRQKHDFDVSSHKATLAAEGEVRKRAVAMAGGPGMPLTDEVWSQAAEQVATQYGMQADLLKERIGLTKARTSEAVANAAAAGSVDPATGLPTMDPLAGMKPGERVRFDQSQQQAAQGVYNKWLGAKAQVDKVFPQLQQLRASLKAAAGQQGADFDETQGVLVNRATGQPVRFLLPAVQRQIDQLRSLAAQAAQAETEVKGQAETLRSQYGPYYNVGADHWQVTPNAQFGGVGQAGAPRNMPPIPEWKAAPTTAVQATEYQSASPLPVGTVIDTKRGKFKVTGLGRKGKDGYIHKIEPVKE